MNYKNQNKQIITDSNNINNFNESKISNKNLHKKQGNSKQMNSKARYNLINSKNKPIKNNIKTRYHYIPNNNEKRFNNTFYRNKNDNIKENHNKFVVDLKESVKHGRNSSAPTLKQVNDKNNKSFLEHNNKKYNFNKLKEKDISYGKSQINNKNKNINPPSRTNNINNHISRINDIKQKFLSKTNRKNYEKINNNNTAYKRNVLNTTSNDINNTNHTDRSKHKKRIKNKDKDGEYLNNTCKDILATQEKIAILKKKLKEDKAILRNSNDFSEYTYNNILNNNLEKKYPDEKDITIDNEEKIINMEGNSTEENKDYSIQKLDNNYRDITPDKSKKYNNSYINNFDSIETNENLDDHTNSKIGTSYIKDKYKINNSKNKNKMGYSYNKQSDHIRKINIPKTDREKDMFKNNYNLYNKNVMNTERIKNGKKKSKKINIINLKSKENNYYYTKSSNIFSTVNNKLNKSSIIPKNKSRNLDTNKENKNLNKTKYINSYDIKKNNSVSKGKIKTDFYNNSILNKLVGKRNLDKSKINAKKPHNKSLNYTYEKINSSKVKKHAPKCKISQSKENKEKEIIKPKEKEIEKEIYKERENGAEMEKENEKIEKKIRNIEKIGVICHAGEVSFGKPKTNQDNYFNFNLNYDDLVFVGVCDGHGENGHYISGFLINHLPTDFQKEYSKLKKSEQIPFEEIPKEIITSVFEKSFLKSDNSLNEVCDLMKKKKAEGEALPIYFNCDYSGSTCVSLLLKQKDISTVYVANVGDSRTIVIRENENNVWTCEQLSRDHKPTEKDEYKRIIDADGEIEAIEDDDGNWTGPLRVWEKGSEGPGLAMTRSLGDKVGTKIGVVCTPEITKYSIKDEDRAFIIASDGLWEYMPNQEVTEAVKELILDMRENNEISADIIANELFKQSVIRWRAKEPGMDDITVICVLLN